MENWIIWLIFAGIFCALLVLHVAAGSKKPFRRALGSALNGLVALVLVNITGGFTGVTLPVSLLSLGVSAGLGIPGVTMLLLLNLIWACGSFSFLGLESTGGSAL